MNLAYHHIRGWIMVVVGAGLARLDCTTITDISTIAPHKGESAIQTHTMSIVRPS